jgi:hypothetical protein
MIGVCFTVILGLGMPSDAKPEPESKLVAQVIYGEVLTTFTVFGPARPSIEMVNSQTGVRKKTLSPQNYQRIVAGFRELPETSEVNACSRSRLEALWQSGAVPAKRKSGCILGTNSTTKGFQEFSNLLVYNAM